MRKKAEQIIQRQKGSKFLKKQPAGHTASISNSITCVISHATPDKRKQQHPNESRTNLAQQACLITNPARII
ncbi:MAG: hypothetical protein JW902_13580 [Syntrophaceae bacterium]|nr:hypothetical protein [Syntrophaceae bacterium]